MTADQEVLEGMECVGCTRAGCKALCVCVRMRERVASTSFTHLTLRICALLYWLIIEMVEVIVEVANFLIVVEVKCGRPM